MKNWMIAIALISSASASANGLMPHRKSGMNDLIRCQTAASENGFAVIVSGGGFIQHNEAVLDRVTDQGVERISDYFIDLRKFAGKVSYVDALTSGRDFNLTLNAEFESADQVVDATLESDSENGRVVESMNCSLMPTAFERVVTGEIR